MKRLVKSRIEQCPHCGSDEISRIRYSSVYVIATRRRVRRSTQQDRLYYCYSCQTLIDVFKREAVRSIR
jgi:predicted RNA-binding Zn-ribbon protein involved in translation (DUF1610 family)